MPLHQGSRTKVQLVTAPLSSTTTDEPSNNKAKDVTEHISNVEQTLKNGHVLKETRIPLADDDNPLHLLGGEEYMPFIFVRAGEDLRRVPATREERVFHPDPARNAIYKRILGGDRATAIKIPQALALRVELSRQSFLRTTAQPPEDIRIDVLFNGQLTHTSMVARRFEKEDCRSSGQLLKVFSGMRFQRLLERAWTIVPHGQDPDGSRRRPLASNDTLEDRWAKIQKEVLKEVAARGLDKSGNRPMTAKYLIEVAKLAMPAELREWSEPRGQAFGVIDVVLSYGQGSKDVPTKIYIQQPTRMKSKAFKVREETAATLYDSIPLQPETPDVDTPGSRYNFRTVTPKGRGAGKGPPPVMGRFPARQYSGKISSQVALGKHSDTLAGPSLERQGNTITTSEQLPPHLSEELSKQGYTLQLPPGADTPSVQASSDIGSDDTPKQITPLQYQPSSFAHSRLVTRRPAGPLIQRLERIPEASEVHFDSSPGDVFTSPATGSRPAPLGFHGRSSSMTLGSSQGSATPLAGSTPGVPSGLLSPALLPPVLLRTGVRAKRMADQIQDEGGSSRKKRRLSGVLSPLDVTKAKDGLGMTNRGVFTTQGSPGDKSQRSMFNSFSLSSRIEVDARGPRSSKRPPASPLSPDLNFKQKQKEPLIKRLVLKFNNKVFHKMELLNPFFMSKLAPAASAAEARSNRQRLMDGKPPFARVGAPVVPATPRNQPIPAASAPSSGTIFTPYTPHPPRTRRHPASSSSSNTLASGTSAGCSGGGIYATTPNPLPRYPARNNAPGTPLSSSSATNTLMGVRTPATTAHRRRTSKLATASSSSSSTTTAADPPPPSSTTAKTPNSSTRSTRTPGTRRTTTTTTTTTARTDDPRHPTAQMEASFRAFAPPDLCRDCAITYAQPPPPPPPSVLAGKAVPVAEMGGGSASGGGSTGDEGGGVGGQNWREWREGEPRAFGGGVVRQVRSERSGEFEEEGILVGVRFVVV